MTPPEAIIEPDLPIIDPHHHLWDLRALLGSFPEPLHPFLETVRLSAHYTFDQFLADTSSGHRIIGTVFMECGAFYDASRSEAMKVVGEVEFVRGVAAQGASGLYGPYRPCAGIVGHADLRLGAEAGNVLDALADAGGPRFKGIRHAGAWDADPSVLGPAFHHPEGLYRDAAFREGFAELGKRGLTFDAWVLEPQLGDVIDLARAFPDQTIVLDHCGTPLGTACYAGKLDENFERWRGSIRELAKCQNVVVKLGGLAMQFCGMPAEGPTDSVSSEELAQMWRPYVDTCIEAFGPDRAMFESNYPVDKWAGSYATVWNALKRLASGASDEEKRALFAGNAARVYDIEHLLELT
ncbi:MULTISPECIES: amidohydrolase family protein [Citromicrobium]|uniref:amidohydrolase family protein n=1 Tax=Citromicrobium TaxID=72173 RepID=UPI0001DD100A|nr:MULTISPECIES: amidohydrolase family protein [Citromicrobium]ALG61165.1 amidohydrolase [Citromicrobium sp. JL477]KPM15327.1 amidohydrolase [Citromicrobium sp. JL1351]KPM19686.1 amidohydrolase [Citromicrobium sp. JL31]KPM26255.1 amidohydrolase [Citromicrobium sp. JL2201]